MEDGFLDVKIMTRYSGNMVDFSGKLVKPMRFQCFAMWL